MFQRLIVASITILVCAAGPALAECGTRGGPGYRGADGRCVGWSNLKAVCGDPPTSHCTDERGPAASKPRYFLLPPPAPEPKGAAPRQPTDRIAPAPETRKGGDLPLNPDVTQATIGETICVKGWTATIRPPASYTNAIKVGRLRAQGLPLELIGDFKLDHRIPLALGGAPSDPRNLILQDADDADQKDDTERCFARAVCAGRISLEDAQRRIWSDWKAAGKSCP